jgi:hypothetical protein
MLSSSKERRQKYMSQEENNFIFRTKLFPMDVSLLFSIFQNPNTVFTDDQIESWNKQANQIRDILDDLIDEANMIMES